MIRIVNFAHGEFVMLAMYGAYLCYATMGLDPYVSVFIVVPAMFIVGVVIHLQVGQSESASFGPRAAMAPENDPHTRHELFDAEGLGHVVVASDREPVDLVLGGVLGGQEDDRHLLAAGIEALEHLEAVDVGEHDVEDHEGG